MSTRAAVLLPAALATALAATAWAHRMEHRISLKDRALTDVSGSKKHERFFPKDAQEVVRHLQALTERLRQWYGRLEATAKKSRGFRFPKSTPWTPAKAACPAGTSAHRPDDAAWEHATWKALDFRPAEPHRFQYRVVAVGSGGEASFSLQARADRDCNGRMALYRLSGHARSGALRFPLLRVRHARE